MTRPPFTLLLLLIAPLVLYALFVWIKNRRLFVRAFWRLRTLMTLAILGLILMIGNLVYLSHFAGWIPGATYEPARLEDGKTVPGRAR